jgi:hypothetical protein
MCCDSDCAYICADDDAQNSNPGGIEGSQQYPLDPPDEDEESYNAREEQCQHCECKDRPDIKTLKKLKRNVIIGKYSVVLAYSILCGIAGGMAFS